MAVDVTRLRRTAVDPADAVARVAAAERTRLLNIHRGRLGPEDLEDCYSQATFELVRATRQGHCFTDDKHVAAVLDTRFAARVIDRQRQLLSGTVKASMARAESLDAPGVAVVADGQDIADHVLRRMEVAQLREVAADLPEEQRRILAWQVSLGGDCAGYVARFGGSAESYRKNAQRARFGLKRLVTAYEQGERCRELEPDLMACVSKTQTAEQRARVDAHLETCRGCALLSRELHAAQRGVAALLPLPTLATAGGLMEWLRRWLPFLDNDATGVTAAGTAGAAAGAGGASVASGGSIVGAGAIKAAAVALCLAGAAGTYEVCQYAGLLPDDKRPSPPAARKTDQAQRKTRPAPATTVVASTRASTKRSPTPSTQPRTRPKPASAKEVDREFGFEQQSSAPAPPPAARPPAPSGPATTDREFDFEQAQGP